MNFVDTISYGKPRNSVLFAADACNVSHRYTDINLSAYTMIPRFLRPCARPYSVVGQTALVSSAYVMSLKKFYISSPNSSTIREVFQEEIK